jgi:hypothetical protein
MGKLLIFNKKIEIKEKDKASFFDYFVFLLLFIIPFCVLVFLFITWIVI